MTEWEKANIWESSWWSDCLDTVGEELKQRTYANRMGIDFNLNGKSVLDLGGGPVSILLKCSDRRGYVVDPLKVPNWVIQRYRENNIEFINEKAEDFKGTKVFDECWIYNVLQHVEKPEKVVEIAKNCSKVIRIFEWIDTPVNEGHINSLHEKDLNSWLGGEGKVE